MFSDLARDDVFRLETARLWLRWPRAQDAESIARAAGDPAVAGRTLDLPSPFPEGAAAELILRARKGNADGDRLHLAITGKRKPREALGCVRLDASVEEGAQLSFWLSRLVWNQGFVSESVAALLDFTFATSDAREIVARLVGLNPAALKICSNLGFLPAETGEAYSAARGEWVQVQTFRLCRNRRRRLGGWSSGRDAMRPGEARENRFAP
jgi:RimJ/RimL family protein N-acetyltransferase